MRRGNYTITIQFQFANQKLFLMVPVIFSFPFGKADMIETAAQILRTLNPDAKFVQLIDITEA